MKGRQIVLDHIGEREAAALIVDGRLEDFILDTDAPRPGTIYRAAADRPVKGQGGMFLKSPDGSVFLKQVKGLSPGQVMLVQVTGFSEDGKAIPVTQKLLFKSRFAIVTPGAPGLNISRSIRDEEIRERLLELAHTGMDGSEDGLILRSACADGVDDDILEDIRAMRDLSEGIMAEHSGEPEKLTDGDGPHVEAWREWSEQADVETEAGGFDRLGVSELLMAATGLDVALGSGASMAVEATRALVAVDVNTGRDTSPAAGLKANMAMARNLPRVLKIRGLGGQIVIDLAPMAKKDRRVFESALRAAFRRDTIDTMLAGWTPLGNYELQRKRARQPLELPQDWQ